MDAGPQLIALADPTRRAIFEMVGRRPRAVGELAQELPVSRPAVSQHLRVLADAGLVTAERHGTRRVYSLDRSGIGTLHTWVDMYWDSVLDAFEAAAREETNR
jgi:DNA-binding transcriptional ArsR family regulator